ncbi:hypothetical protein MtrunA17_Chr6g0462781 [Medicago truncatula]|uniref:Uncharacterized protein n=1 Tax=Medicago truncatula TaxID=3880 RepID=A0A396HCB3_MEDTR|nr:hypothetical protein MtrunA17_Chr6g0462781 [Medicago truncatula]
MHHDLHSINHIVLVIFGDFDNLHLEELCRSHCLIQLPLSKLFCMFPPNQMISAYIFSQILLQDQVIVLSVQLPS